MMFVMLLKPITLMFKSFAFNSGTYFSSPRCIASRLSAPHCMCVLESETWILESVCVLQKLCV